MPAAATAADATTAGPPSGRGGGPGRGRSGRGGSGSGPPGSGSLRPGATRGAGGRTTARRAAVLSGAAVAVVVVLLLSVAVGSKALGPGEVLDALVRPDGSESSIIVRELRLPRALVGLVAGAALGVSGVLLQGLTRNPLADPGLLGVSAGAAFAVVLGIALLGVSTPGAYVWLALAGAAASFAVVWGLAGAGAGRRGASPVTLVLAGVAVAAVLTSLTTVMVLLDADTLDQFRFWQVGSLAGRGLDVLVPVLPVVAVGGVLALASARSLDLLALGEDTARGLGQRTRGARLLVATAATVLAGGSVAASGPVVFVGLAVPHVARALVGPAHRWLIPLSALLGVVLLVGSDVLGRVVARPSEVQVGVVTAVVGAPFLLALARRRRVVRA